VIFGASIHDGAAPLFCKASDGAVLVITANQTRREAAVRAKEILLSWNAQLLGAVLDNRAFPVPESIYRRL
jgi:Mrp family chromosome partitioning ATPase